MFLLIGFCLLDVINKMACGNGESTLGWQIFKKTNKQKISGLCSEKGPQALA